jgi:putative (di)nucleoside polyphosphate hydrolase
LIEVVIENDGYYREGVGIVILNDQKKLFWGRRIGQDAWQFPQGGILPNETPEQAMYRELYEEVGLTKQDIEIVAVSQEWFVYDLPPRLIRQNTLPICIGQKQKWFLVKLISCVDNINLAASGKPEFDEWCWVNYWYPLKEVINFKRKVYRDALQEFTNFVFPDKRLRNPKQNLRSALRPRRKTQFAEEELDEDSQLHFLRDARDERGG